MRCSIATNTVELHRPSQSSTIGKKSAQHCWPNGAPLADKDELTTGNVTLVHKENANSATLR